MRNVNRLKTTYQRNMLIGQGIVLLFVGVYCAIFMDRPISKSTVEGILYTNFYLGEKNQIELTSKPAKKHIGKWPLKNRDGFLGFDVKFNITDDINDKTPLTNKPPIILPDEPFVDPDIASYSAISGDQSGLFLASNVEYLYQPIKKRPSIDIDVKVKSKTDPEYPLVALEANIEGEVEILVFINSLGDISDFPLENADGNIELRQFCIIKEIPSDWFFASNLINELPKWKFHPKIENGIRIGSFLKIKYEYRLSKNSSQANIIR